jgi:RNA polymerase sigma-70 factor (ECF subfamily)
MDDEWTSVFSRVKRALRKLGRSPHDAEDIVQEAYVRLIRYRVDNVVEKPEAFLMTVALNLSRDASREYARHGMEVCLDDVAVVDTAPTLEDALFARERHRHLLECIGRLPEKTRAVFLAHRIDGLSYQQIARDRGLSVSSVEKHIAKALLLLAEGMAGWYP